MSVHKPISMLCAAILVAGCGCRNHCASPFCSSLSEALATGRIPPSSSIEIAISSLAQSSIRKQKPPGCRTT